MNQTGYDELLVRRAVGPTQSPLPLLYLRASQLRQAPRRAQRAVAPSHLPQGHLSGSLGAKLIPCCTSDTVSRHQRTAGTCDDECMCRPHTLTSIKASAILRKQTQPDTSAQVPPRSCCYRASTRGLPSQ